MATPPVSADDVSHHTGPTTFFEKMKQMSSKNGTAITATARLENGTPRDTKAPAQLSPIMPDFTSQRKYSGSDGGVVPILHSPTPVRLSKNHRPSMKISENIPPALQALQIKPIPASSAARVAPASQKPASQDNLTSTSTTKSVENWQNGLVERSFRVSELSNTNVPSTIAKPSTTSEAKAIKSPSTTVVTADTVVTSSREAAQPTTVLPADTVTIKSREVAQSTTMSNLKSPLLPLDTDTSNVSPNQRAPLRIATSFNVTNKASPKVTDNTNVPAVAATEEKPSSKNVIGESNAIAGKSTLFTIASPESGITKAESGTTDTTVSTLASARSRDIKAQIQTIETTESAVAGQMVDLLADLEGVNPISACTVTSRNVAALPMKELLEDVREAQESINRNTLRVLEHEGRFEELEWRIGHIEKIMDKACGPFPLTVKFPTGRTLKVDGVMARMKLVDLLHKVNELTGKRFSRCTFKHNEVTMSMSERVGDYSVLSGDEVYLVDAPTLDQ